METIGKIFVFLVVVVALSLLMAWPIMLITNYLFTTAVLVAVFGGPLTLWKALLLNILMSLLFGSANTSSKD